MVFSQCVCFFMYWFNRIKQTQAGQLSTIKAYKMNVLYILGLICVFMYWHLKLSESVWMCLYAQHFWVIIFLFFLLASFCFYYEFRHRLRSLNLCPLHFAFFPVALACLPRLEHRFERLTMLSLFLLLNQLSRGNCDEILKQKKERKNIINMI